MINCENCNRVFLKQCNLIRHQKSNTKCIKTNIEEQQNNICDNKSLTKKYENIIKDNSTNLENLIKEKNKIRLKIYRIENRIIDEKICKFCKRIFSTKYVMKTHLSEYCKEHKKIYDELNKFNDLILQIKLKNKNNKQQNKLQNRVNNINNINNNITNTNSNNTITNNNTINIVNFGSETLEHLSRTEILELLSTYFDGFKMSIVKTHFDERAPQQHNIMLEHPNKNFVKCKQNNKWGAMDRDDAIKKIKDSNMRLLEDTFDVLHDNIPEHIKTKFNKFSDNYYDLDDDRIKDLNKEIKFILYNKDFVKK